MSDALQEELENYHTAVTELRSRYEFIDDFHYPEGTRIAVNFTCDFDAMLFRRVMNEPLPMRARGEFGGRVGVWRLIELFNKYHVKSTFFIPGRICELYPESVKAVADNGHEVAEHMWEHKPPKDGDEWAEDHLHKSTIALANASGRRPTGTRSGQRRDLLLKEGYLYESHGSASHLPYYVSDPDGSDTLLNIPFHFAIDDAMFFSFAWVGTGNEAQRITDCDRVLEMWWSAFLDQYKVGGYLNIVLHPFVSGRAMRIDMIEELIVRMQKLPGVWFPTCEELARHCYESFPPKRTAATA